MRKTFLIGAGILGLGLFLYWKRSSSGSLGALYPNVGVTMGSENKELEFLNLVGEVKRQYPFLTDVPDLLVLGIAKTESGLRPGLTGAAGEYGIMQVLPITWGWICNKYGLELTNHYDMLENVTVGMLVLYDYNLSLGGDWGATVHSYNVGVGGYKNGRRNDAYAEKVASNMGLFDEAVA